MSQQRQFQMVGGNNPGQFNDTTFTKIFVGGLAWETKRDTMKSYFEQFGEILEAVVITDKNTGRSKGYGFVTFKDPEAARRACVNPSPFIDGRRANCNLAALGAQKTRPPISQHGAGRFRAEPGPGLMAPSGYHGPSAYIQQQPTGMLDTHKKASILRTIITSMVPNSFHLTTLPGHRQRRGCFIICIHFMLNMHNIIKLMVREYNTRKSFNILICLSSIPQPVSYPFHLQCPWQQLPQPILRIPQRRHHQQQQQQQPG